MFRHRTTWTCKRRLKPGKEIAMATKTKASKKRAKAGLRRGEREAAFAKLGKATPTGMAQFMAGVKPARGVFAPVKSRKRN